MIQTRHIKSKPSKLKELNDLILKRDALAAKMEKNDEKMKALKIENAVNMDIKNLHLRIQEIIEKKEKIMDQMSENDKRLVELKMELTKVFSNWKSSESQSSDSDSNSS